MTTLKTASGLEIRMAEKLRGKPFTVKRDGREVGAGMIRGSVVYFASAEANWSLSDAEANEVEAEVTK